MDLNGSERSVLLLVQPQHEMQMLPAAYAEKLCALLQLLGHPLRLWNTKVELEEESAQQSVLAQASIHAP